MVTSELSLPQWRRWWCRFNAVSHLYQQGVEGSEGEFSELFYRCSNNVKGFEVADAKLITGWCSGLFAWGTQLKARNTLVVNKQAADDDVDAAAAIAAIAG